VELARCYRGQGRRNLPISGKGAAVLSIKPGRHKKAQKNQKKTKKKNQNPNKKKTQTQQNQKNNPPGEQPQPREHKKEQRETSGIARGVRGLGGNQGKNGIPRTIRPTNRTA